MRNPLKTFLTHERATTFADVLGAGLIASGVGILAGLGAGLIAAGILILAFSYLVAR